MGKIVNFPSKKEAPVKLEPLVQTVKKFVIEGEDFIVDSVTRPVWFTEEWEVHTLTGPSYVAGPHYWAPMSVIGPEEFGDAIQAAFPLKKMALEFIDPNTGIIEDWWEFQDVYLSTETDSSTFVVFFREAIKRD